MPRPLPQGPASSWPAYRSRQNRRLGKEVDPGQPESSVLIGESEPMKQLFSVINRIAPTENSVLITGATGTGKELVAQAIHNASGRSGPFVGVNCSALPETLVEAELFGHERGSFTGADERRPGLFEFASGGTLLLD